MQAADHCNVRNIFLLSFLKSTFLIQKVLEQLNSFIYHSPRKVGTKLFFPLLAVYCVAPSIFEMRKQKGFHFFAALKKTLLILSTLDTLNPFGGEDLFFLLLNLSCLRRFIACRHENREENKVTLLFILIIKAICAGKRLVISAIQRQRSIVHIKVSLVMYRMYLLLYLYPFFSSEVQDSFLYIQGAFALYTLLTHPGP